MLNVFVLVVSLTGPSSCDDAATYAHQAMTWRQSGTQLEHVLPSPDKRSEFYIVWQAYQRPVYATRELQRQAVRDFRKQMRQECRDAHGGNRLIYHQL